MYIFVYFKDGQGGENRTLVSGVTVQYAVQLHHPLVGWEGRARTSDRPGNNRVLYHLSYSPPHHRTAGFCFSARGARDHPPQSLHW